MINKDQSAVTLCALLCLGSSLAAQQAIRFEDMSEKLGIVPLMKGWALGHGGA